MANLLDRDNLHIFLEKMNNKDNSFIANVNLLASNLDNIELFDPEEYENAKNIIDNVQQWLNEVGTEIGDRIYVTPSGATTARTLADRFADVVNVKDFGAVGDGITDDTAAIQAAIDYAYSNGKIQTIVGYGVFLISNQLRFPFRADFRHGSLHLEKVIVSKDWALTEADPAIFIGAQFFDAYIGFLDCNFQCAGIRLDGTDETLLPGCTVYHFKTYGIYLARGGNVTINQPTVFQYIQADNKYDIADWTAVGLLCNGIDSTIIGGNIGWCSPCVKLTENAGWLKFSNLHLWATGSVDTKMGDTVCLESWVPSPRQCTFTGCYFDTGHIDCYGDGLCIEDSHFFYNTSVNTFTQPYVRWYNYNVASPKNLRISFDTIQDNMFVEGIGFYDYNTKEALPDFACIHGDKTWGNTNKQQRIGLDASYIVPYTGTSPFRRVFTPASTIEEEFLFNDSRSVVSHGGKQISLQAYDRNSDNTFTNVHDAAIEFGSKGAKIGQNGTMDALALFSRNEKVVDVSRFSAAGRLGVLHTNIDALQHTRDAQQFVEFSFYGKDTNVQLQRELAWYQPSGGDYGRRIDVYAIDSSLSGITYGAYMSVSDATRVFFFGTDMVRSEYDNKTVLGTASKRWSQVYAGTAAINTSDAREKVNLTNPDEALMHAWGKVNFKAFQFTDAVEKKREEARIHFGVIAQQVQEAFASEGLDASKYALFCYDKWDDEYEDVEVIDTEATYDENGNELTPQISHIEKKLVTPAGDRYGIRYSEALALEAAYQRWLGEQRDKEIAELKAMLANSKPTGYTLS